MQEKEPRWKSPEFILVVVMLAVLTILVGLVLWAPLPKKDYTATATVILDYRKSILSIIITAFGAWVGAGAAYFFGRENLREAAQSLLAMREPPPRERLRRTPVREMPLKPLDWVVKTDKTLKDIVDKLKAKPGYWFITIVNKADGTLKTVIEEEAVWRFLNMEILEDEEKRKQAEDVYKGVMGMKVNEVLKLIEKTEALKKFKDCYVPVTLDKSAGDVHELMQNKGVFLAVVLDDTGKPTHFFTTSDVRQVLLQMS